MSNLAPIYLKDAIAAYNEADRRHARLTIAVSLAAEQWAIELMQSGGGSKSKAAATVRSFLAIELGGKSKVSRFLNVAKFVAMVDSENLTLEGIPSQGMLFAILPVINEARKSGRQLPLPELLADAATLTVQEFNKKWRGARLPNKRVVGIAEVLCFVQATSNPSQLRQIADAVLRRKEAILRTTKVASSQLFSGATL